MPTLQIRDLSQDVYDELKLRAEREHRSMAQQATVAIEQHLRLVPTADECALSDAERREERIRRRRDLLDCAARGAQGPVFEVPDDFPSAAQIVRELRDAR